MVIVMALGVCTVSLAEETKQGTAAGLRSRGAIVYREGEQAVVLDADDLYALADRLDRFKVSAVNQMAALHTYFTRQEKGAELATSDEMHVVHRKPSDSVEPLSLDFDTIMEGFAASQTIPFVSSEYGYEEGTKLYRTEAGRLTTEGGGAGTQEISIAAATADNLSAGCAAWVNGELLLGTGMDNQTYFDRNDVSHLFDSIESVGNPCTLSRGSYMYIMNNAATTASSGLYFLPNVSITNSPVNSITAVRNSSGIRGSEGDSNKVYLGYRIYHIQINDESADVNITQRASTGAGRNITNRMCIKMK